MTLNYIFCCTEIKSIEDITKITSNFLTLIQKVQKTFIKSKASTFLPVKSKKIDGVVMRSLFVLFDSAIDFEDFAIEVTALFCNSHFCNSESYFENGTEWSATQPKAAEASKANCESAMEWHTPFHQLGSSNQNPVQPKNFRFSLTR